MTNCIWLLALVVAINARSLHVPHGYGGGLPPPPPPPPHLLPNPYYAQPYGYPPAPAYGYGYQPQPLLYSPPGSYYDSMYGIRKPLPGGGNPVAVDYVGLLN